MKLLLINSVCGIKSTGRICTDIADEYQKKGYDVVIAYGREKVPPKYKNISYRIGNELNVRFNAGFCRIFDNDGFSAKSQTKKFLKWADDFDPDVLWIHNLHGYYINVQMLFSWIKSRPKMIVKWTLHDCWAFTGHCTYFSFRGCYKWEKECINCPAKKEYPSSFIFSNSERNFRLKKESFLGVNNLILITPSKWLAELVKQSFLGCYKIKVKYNTIDKNVFKPTPSDFRKKHNLEDKKIVLGVASTWDQRKGLKDFYNLSLILPKDYVIVLVGLSKKQIKEAPKSIIKIESTNSKKKLAEIYSAADVFLNPSKEETFGMTTIEAAACGTPSIVLKNTACEEIADYFSGVAVNNSVEEMKKAIIDIVERL